MPETTDDGRTLTGLLVNSDRTKDVVIYRISWDEFCNLIQSLAIDDIVEFSYNRITGAMVKRGTNTASHASSF
jgi:hypothetical protein